MKISDPQRKRLRTLANKLGYETALGVHTYHQCRCGRMETRAGECALCIVDEIELWKICAESGAKNQETEDNKEETK